MRQCPRAPTRRGRNQHWLRVTVGQLRLRLRRRRRASAPRAKVCGRHLPMIQINRLGLRKRIEPPASAQGGHSGKSRICRNHLHLPLIQDSKLRLRPRLACGARAEIRGEHVIRRREHLPIIQSDELPKSHRIGLLLGAQGGLLRLLRRNDSRGRRTGDELLLLQLPLFITCWFLIPLGIFTAFYRIRLQYLGTPPPVSCASFSILRM
jgi:hypothetical protein